LQLTISCHFKFFLAFVFAGFQYLYQWKLPLLSTLQAAAQPSRADEEVAAESHAPNLSAQKDTHADQE